MALRYRPKRTIEVEALGDAVTVAAAGGGYTAMSGTSFATPLVSGMCGAAARGFPYAPADEVRAVINSYGSRGEALALRDCFPDRLCRMRAKLPSKYCAPGLGNGALTTASMNVASSCALIFL